MSGKSRRRRASVAVAVAVLGGLGITLVTSGCSGPGRVAAEASPAVSHHFPGSSAAVPVATARASLSESGLIGFAAGELLNSDPSSQLQQLQQMKSMGMTTVRVDANWLTGEPNKGEFDWSTLDAVMASVHHVGMTADLIIDGCPPWAAAQGASGQFAQPASPAQFGAWGAAVAARYSSMGAHYFEIWNEPNLTNFWSPSPNPAAYTADLQAAYVAIKAADPSSVVISAGLAAIDSNSGNIDPVTFLRAMYSDGAKGNFDAVGDHPYSFPADPNNDAQGKWGEMDQSSPSLRSIMTEHGDGAKKIWITEFGAPTGDVTEAQQATELTQAISPPRTPAGSGPSTSTPGAIRTAERASVCSTPTASPNPPTTPYAALTA